MFSHLVREGILCAFMYVCVRVNDFADAAADAAAVAAATVVVVVAAPTELNKILEK